MTSLDAIKSRISGMSAEERAELERLVSEDGEKWIPNVGPQTVAAYSPADVLLYGGQGGGGKSDLGLGLAFTQHYRTLILRRKYVDLTGLIDRAKEINGTTKGYNGSIPPKLRTTDNRLIQFGANQHLGDEQSWQGIPFDLKCVGKGTKVVMADGSMKPIEQIRPGDSVDTLEGARGVVRVFPVRIDDAVSVRAYDDSGSLVTQQVQSLTHEILTTAGWVSCDKYASPPLSLISEPKQYHFLGRSAKWFAERFAAAWRHLKETSCRLVHDAALHGWLPGHRSALATCACMASEGPQTGSVGFDGERPAGLLPPLLNLFHGGRFLLSRGRASPSWPHCTFGTQGCDAGSSLGPPDSLGHYSGGSRRHDGRALNRLGSAPDGGACQVYLRQPCGAEQPSPTDFAGDAPDRIPIHSFHKFEYAHPYTKEIRLGLGDISIHSLVFTPVGKVELYDIEVEDVNHFITEAGFINKNCFDEACQFLEDQVSFHLGWIRSAIEGQRSRALLASNPPIDAAGDWLIKKFRPWLDLTHHNPAKHGELRWFITDDDGEDVEVEGPEPIERGGETYTPKSRTFIPAALKDNPFLINSGYQATLDALPEPLRSAVRDGNFMAARSDAPYQVIPTDWIIAAQNRWTEDGWKKWNMTAMALDPAGDGSDAEELGWRHGPWFSKLLTKRTKGAKEKGREKESARENASRGGAVEIFMRRKHGAPVVIDVGGGYAGETLARLGDNDVPYVRFNGASSGNGRSQETGHPFANKRAEAWWRMREALDPNQDGGSVIALPPDPELRADLAAPVYISSVMQQRGMIQIESKDSLRARLGRSTGKGDTVVMCLYGGDPAVERSLAKRGSANQGLPSFAKMKGGPLRRNNSRSNSRNKRNG